MTPPARAPSRHNRRRRLAVSAITGIALLAVAATGARLAAQDLVDRTTVDCHTTVEPSDGADFAGTGLSFADPGDGQPPVDDPLGACADLYRQGVLELGAPNAVLPSAGDHEVPALVGCVMPEGTAAVYPSTRQDVCEQLGLAPLS